MHVTVYSAIGPTTRSRTGHGTDGKTNPKLASWARSTYVPDE
jgi:hypothetical protein